MLRIESVEPIPGYKLKVCLNNGNALLLSLENKLNALRFWQLKDREFFENVTTDGYCVRWNELIELSITEIFEIVKQ